MDDGHHPAAAAAARAQGCPDPAPLRDALREALKPAEKAKKALDALCKKGALERIDALGRELGALEGAELGGLGLEAERAQLADGLRRHLERLRTERRASVMGPLQRLAQADGVPVRVLSESPPTLLLAPLGCELDFEAGVARLTYAREPVMEAGLDAKEILAQRDKAMALIRDAAEPTERFFRSALAAYRLVLAAREAEPGDRVDLVDLLAPLGLLATDSGRWRKTPLSKMSDYPRYLLAYQLQRLRREGALEQGGRRIDLGTATGGATRDKRNVLYIPTTADEGQYYLSVRFVAAGSP